jgi:hypothetical protein
MWRVLLIVIGVLAVDLALFSAVLGPADANTDIRKVSQAIQAREQNPSVETQRALIAALNEGYFSEMNRRTASYLAILCVTGGGMFVAGRGFERGRLLAKRSTVPANATQNI